MREIAGIGIALLVLLSASAAGAPGPAPKPAAPLPALPAAKPPAAKSPAKPAPAAPAPAAAEVPPAALPAATSLQSMQNLDELAGLSYRSMLYSPEDTQRIRAAISVYRVNQARAKGEAMKGEPERQDFITALVQAKPEQPKEIEHAQFYLSSIAYHGPDDWVVWANTMKFTPKTAIQGELTVTQVTPGRVSFLWKPHMFDIYATRSPADPLQPILMDAKAGTIVFRLFPNQSFSAYSLAIQEGYLPPVRVEPIVLPPSGINALVNSLKGQGNASVSVPEKSELPPVPAAGIYH